MELYQFSFYRLGCICSIESVYEYSQSDIISISKKCTRQTVTIRQRRLTFFYAPLKAFRGTRHYQAELIAVLPAAQNIALP